MVEALYTTFIMGATQVIRLTTIVFFCCFGAAQGDNCTVADFSVEQNFDPSKFSGKWYEIKWIIEPWIPVEWNFLDYFQDFTLNGNDYAISWQGRVSRSSEYCMDGTSALYSTGDNAKYIYNRKFNSTTRLNSTYMIISTDYDHYALAYGCRELAENGSCLQPDCWLWSRTPQIDNIYLQTMESQLSALCLTTDMFIPTLQQKECTTGPVNASTRLCLCWVLVLSPLIWVLKGLH